MLLLLVPVLMSSNKETDTCLFNMFLCTEWFRSSFSSQNQLVWVDERDLSSLTNIIEMKMIQKIVDMIGESSLKVHRDLEPNKRS
jgi:hypothetical protein